MCRELIEEIYLDAKKHGNNKIKIVTNHLKITGMLEECDCENKKDDCYIITITDGKMWRMEDICTCQSSDCRCNDVNFLHFNELHVNVAKIIAFSLTN